MKTIACAAAFAAVLAGCEGGKTGVGKAAPDFTLTEIDGATVSLSGLAGRPVVLSFFFVR